MRSEVIHRYTACSQGFDDRIRQAYGLKSEINVLQELAKLSYIKTVIATGQYSELDHQGVDLIAEVAAHENIDSFKIQVKSGITGIKSFYEKIMKKYNIDETQVQIWLKQHKLIIIDGSISSKAIRRSFEMQAKDIWGYHRPYHS